MSHSQYEAIFNDGERLIPEESHDLAEVVRHKSSYRFFREIIEADIQRMPGTTVRILDLGCGVGHGSFLLSTLPNVQITGIDPSPESIDYARVNYAADNISYVNVDAQTYLEQGQTFDYIVSRHALEHIENGLELARRFRCLRRLMINVPYKEPEGNIHHKVHFIQEQNFIDYQDAEFFFEDMQGVTETAAEKLDFANSIICILTLDDSPRVGDILSFPFAAWQPTVQERIITETSASLKQYKQEIDAVKNQLVALRADVDTTRLDITTMNATLDVIRNNVLFRALRKITGTMKKSA